ncbi:uncharacterized protein BX664DRAFT_284703 [Halteromyces radiatus]|uniref:uncharacterized protein n=1 Tax=Halteromyces radiatus TaxID=101107 RepID=UPI00221ECB70|nr:uncharacterized protein BX664DRAFT_284703 [Halteromyces radiatus]KAI8082910.1 hypothetical protein BX664DRAFT_284703 [Halteromyces radiatus]
MTAGKETIEETSSVPVEKRIYVGGLPSSVTVDQLETRFAKFGSISNVTIAKNEQGECRGFGHFTIKTTPKQWTSCLSVYNGSKWKGEKIRLEDSKPDYKERKRKTEELLALKAEKKRKRERRWNNSDGFFARDMSLVTDNNVNTRSGGWKRGRYGRAVAVMRLRKEDGTRFVYDPLNYKNNLEKLYNIGVRMKPTKDLPMFYEEYEQQNDQDALFKQQQYIPDDNDDNKDGDIDFSQTTRSDMILSSKDKGEERRLAALERRSLELSAKKESMKQAEQDRQHISFDKDEDVIEYDEHKTDIDIMNESNVQPKDGAKWMFDSDSDDDDDLDIRINPVLEGEKGRQRLELQSRYQGDDRFKLDSEFMDEDEEEITQPTKPTINDDISKSLGDEKNQSLDVLRAMFGDIKVMTQTKPEGQWSSSARFDPEAEDSSNYLIQSTKLETATNESQDDDDLEDNSINSNDEDLPTTRRPESAMPVVSTEKHFSVNVNLKPLFGAEEEPFTLFGGNVSDDADETGDTNIFGNTTSNDLSTGFIPQTTESHVGLGLMFFLHSDDPNLVKRSCYSYDPNGIFQRNQNESEKYETEWKTERNIFSEILKRREKYSLRKQKKETNGGLK